MLERNGHRALYRDIVLLAEGMELLNDVFVEFHGEVAIEGLGQRGDIR
jgi:hypothetical protein